MVALKDNLVGSWRLIKYEELPVDGLVHVSTLTDDYYYYDEASHSLTGRRTKRRYRLGDKVHVKVVRVDLQRRQLDLRVKGKGAS